MNKESFQQQVEESKEKIVKARAKKEKENLDNYLMIDHKDYLPFRREIKYKIEITEEEKIAETKKNFVDTGIIEVLEELRDKNIFTWGESHEKIYRKNFLGIKTNRYDLDTQIRPATIKYDIDQVTIHYIHNQFGTSIPRWLSILKNNSSFDIEAHGAGINKTSRTPSEIIKDIAEVVAIKQLDDQIPKPTF